LLRLRKTILFAVRSLRVLVEPAEVELDEDNGLLWTSLQTAFPGCSGMYYRDREADCRSAVKFDGKKFLPPGGQWNDRQYYVTLSQRCHAGLQTFGSYESATRQFERSVTAVQNMLGSSLFHPQHRTRKAVSKTSHDMAEEPAVVKENVDPLKAVQEGRKLSPIEQQFVDLAKISTGKDVIIDQQREQLRKNDELLQKSEM
uniref:TDP43_N domain-containing protein n=1 Tax=Nippostrongylus brasiliensis TaxID=27835 RepID=A0A0N4XIB6_NIPBR